MRTTAWIPVRRLGRTLLALCLLSQTACSSFRSVHPREVSNQDFQNVSEIVVVERSGLEHTFVAGHIEDRAFHGVAAQSTKPVIIPLDEISHFELKHFSGGRTTLAVAGGVVVGLLAVGVAIVAIASCPHVYSDDGQGFVLDAEPYSGALVASAKRTDLQRLDHLRPRDGTYTLQMVNEVREIEHTDHVKLLVADADSSLLVLPDGKGGVLGVSSWELPVAARTRTGKDLMPLLDARGEFFWEGEPFADYSEGRPRDEMVLKFARPPGAEQATFLLRGGNTQWSMYVMQDFLNRFGKSASKRLERLGHDPAGKERVERFMRDNGVWLEVQVRRDGRWERAGFLREVGATVVKTQALRIPLGADGVRADGVRSDGQRADGANARDASSLPPVGERAAADTLELRLRWAPLFWNLFKVGVDWTAPSQDIALQEAEMLEARDAQRGDIRGLLQDQDGQVYRTVQGDEATLVFRQPPPVAGRQRTLFVEASGHYELDLPDGHDRKLLASMLQVLRRQGLDSYSLEKIRVAAGRSARH